MAKLISPLVLLRIALLIIIVTACKKDKEDPQPTEETAAEKTTTLMTAGKWSPDALTNWVMVEGVNVSELFTGFTITFTKTGYTTTGTSPVWPASDTWTFKDPNNPTVFIRASDGKEVTIESLTENKFKITLVWDKETTTGGRSQSVKGKHEFNLAK